MSVNASGPFGVLSVNWPFSSFGSSDTIMVALTGQLNGVALFSVLQHSCVSADLKLNDASACISAGPLAALIHV